MARPAKFRTDDLLDAAAKAILEHGRDASVSEVGHIAGAPTGSIYHRFSSRTELFVGLWLRSVRRFQAGFMEACRTPDASAPPRGPRRDDRGASLDSRAPGH